VASFRLFKPVRSEPLHDNNRKFLHIPFANKGITSQRVLKVLFYVNILQYFFVVENFTANAVSVAIGDNGNRHSHGHKKIQHPNVKKSSKPRPLQYYFNDLLSNIQKPVRSEPLHENNRKFVHIPFVNKGIDAINISEVSKNNIKY
jgi:hypothetical protein